MCSPQIRSTRAVRIACAVTALTLLAPHAASATLCLSVRTNEEFRPSCQIGESCTVITGPNQTCQVVTCEVSVGCPNAPDNLGRECYTDAACGGYLTCVGATTAQAEFDEGTPGHCTVPEAPPPAPTVEYHPVQAKLQIEIPNLEFSKLAEKITPGETLSIPWIAQYIAAVFRWAVRLGAVLAVIMIMIGGVIWMTSGATGALSKAKEMMTNAVIGLILLVGSYTTLYLVNPDLVAGRALQIQTITRREIPEEDHAVFVAPCEAGLSAGGPKQQCLLRKLGRTEAEVTANLVEVMYRGTPIRIHKLAEADLRAVINEIEALDYDITRDPGGGTFNWRCNRNNPKQLSNHSYGLAIDVNPRTNPNCRKGMPCYEVAKDHFDPFQLADCSFGPPSPDAECRPFDIPPQIVEAFKRHNFDWGGNWRSVKDYMHFDWNKHGC